MNSSDDCQRQIKNCASITSEKLIPETISHNKGVPLTTEGSLRCIVSKEHLNYLKTLTDLNT